MRQLCRHNPKLQDSIAERAAPPTFPRFDDISIIIQVVSGAFFPFEGSALNRIGSNDHIKRSNDHIKQPFFIPTALLDDPNPKPSRTNRKSTTFTSNPTPPNLRRLVLVRRLFQHRLPQTARLHRVQAARSPSSQLPQTKIQRPTTPPRPTLPGLTRLGSSLHPAINHPPINSFLTVQTIVQPRSPTSSFQLPARSSLTSKFIALHTKLQRATGPNASTLHLPVPSKLNIPEWRSRLRHYPDIDLCDFREFGWPTGHASTLNIPASSQTNHRSARANPQIIAAIFFQSSYLTAGYFSPSNRIQPLRKTTRGR